MHHINVTEGSCGEGGKRGWRKTRRGVPVGGGRVVSMAVVLLLVLVVMVVVAVVVVVVVWLVLVLVLVLVLEFMVRLVFVLLFAHRHTLPVRGHKACPNNYRVEEKRKSEGKKKSSWKSYSAKSQTCGEQLHDSATVIRKAACFVQPLHKSITSSGTK